MFIFLFDVLSKMILGRCLYGKIKKNQMRIEIRMTDLAELHNFGTLTNDILLNIYLKRRKIKKKPNYKVIKVSIKICPNLRCKYLLVS